MRERTIELDARVYGARAVKAAVKDYSASAEITMEKVGESFIIKISSYPEEYEDTIEQEFCNYALWKTRS